MTQPLSGDVRAEIEQLRHRVRELEQRADTCLRRLVERLPAPAVHVTAGNVFLNRGAEAITGYDSGELPTLDSWFRHLYGDRAGQVRALYEAERQAGLPRPVTVGLLRRDGEERLVEFTGWGEGDHEVWLLRDVTDSARLARLLEQTARTAQIGGWELDCRTQSLFWTEETYRIHEVSPEDYRPEVQSSIAFYAPESIPIITEALRRGMAEGEPWDLELGLVTAKGRRLWVRAVGVAERAEGRTVRLFGSFQDVTARREAGEALRRSEEQKRRLIASSPDCLAELDLDGKVLFLNARGRELLEVEDDSEVLGRPWSELWPEQSQPALREALRSACAGNDTRFQAHGPTRKGTTKWWDVQLTAVRDAYGWPERLLAVARDVTALERAESERRELERNLQQTQKLESLGVLAGGIAHDFNNLLTGILGNTDLLRHALPPGPPADVCLDQIERAAERAADLCRQMLAYAGKGRFVVEPVDLGALVRDTAPLLQLSISKKASLTICLAEGLPAILGDLTQLRQVLMNLVINASEALGDSEGLIAVSTSRQTVDGATLQAAHPGSAPSEGEYVVLEVGDTGSGMDEETRRRIFEPFFTTKFTGRGLGLSAVLGIVRGHHGILQVHTAPWRGSTFRLFFPPTGQPAQERQAARRLGPSWHGLGTVLVVDDEEPVRQVTRALIGSLGFHVVLAENGREALRKLSQHAAEVRVVLLDLTMPRLDGEQTLAELRRVAPELPVVLMSGYSERELSERFADRGLAGFLQKPFTREDVRRRLREALGE
jgi:PAS domain S-box-containing protein